MHTPSFMLRAAVFAVAAAVVLGSAPMGGADKRIVLVAGARVDDNTAFDNADAVLSYADGGRGHPAIQGDHLKVLEGLAAKGVGLGFAHYGVEVPTGAPAEAMHRWIGGFYEDKFSVNPMWKPPFEKLPAHPVTRGV